MSGPRAREGRAGGELFATDRYGLVLASIVAAYLLSAVVDQGGVGRAANAIVAGLVLVLTLRASGVAERTRHIASAITGIVLVAALVGVAVGDGPSELVAWTWVALVMVSIGAILRRLVRHPTVDGQSVLAAISAYLLIGIGFSGAYRAIDLFTPEGFFAQPGPIDGIDFTYFSFITLTTLGFGDLTPRGDLAKALVTIEALLGQMFLVTVVAALVGNFGRQRRGPLVDEGDDAADG